ncbi:MAG TPA: gas vesicle protein [Bacillota bacterium]|nr:gas vesicle protein [Bacillota bacterium]
MEHSVKSTNIADILERVLDKGLVIAGDISISIADIDLLKIKIRLLVASVDKAREIGINWWETDPYLSTAAQKQLEGKQVEPLAQVEEPERPGRQTVQAAQVKPKRKRKKVPSNVTF